MNTAKTKTSKPSYLVSEIIDKIGIPQVYGETLVKPAMLACIMEVLGNDAVSTMRKIPISNDTITRRQNEMSNFVEEKIVEILENEKFISRWMRAQFITKLSFLSMSDLSMNMI